uniref:Uncharacterized protein n=1 Tax=Picea glauca TaxID=3330 RepID=A0A101LZ19_PICGL|nr:hypothetical protein ABT39_MTgene4959 [Picea glauca]
MLALMLQGLDIDQTALPRKLPLLTLPLPRRLVVKLSKLHLKLALDPGLAQVMALARMLGDQLVFT